MKPVTVVASAAKVLKRRMQRVWRARRMEAFVERMKPFAGARVIDLGGTPELWEMIELPLEVTLLNLPGDIARWDGPARREYRIVAGDACTGEPFPDRAFDLVFSNSVIEHLRSDQHAAFARTVQRLAPSWWIQTPSKHFPIEAHCSLPFWWFYPEALKKAWIERWQAQGRDYRWVQMVTTCVITEEELRALFPGSEMYTEYVAGFPKSHSVYHRA